MTFLDADAVAVLQALRSPRTVPQIRAAIAKAGAPLSEDHVQAAVAAQLLAGHLSSSLTPSGDLRYDRTRTGKAAIRRHLAQTNPSTTVTLQALELLDRFGPLTPAQFAFRLGGASQYRAEQLLRYVESSGRAEQIGESRTWRITPAGQEHLRAGGVAA